MDTQINHIKYSENAIEFLLPLNTFTKLASTVSIEDFLAQIIGGDQNKKYLLNNALFIFDNLTWLNLQLLFRYLNIVLSGGSISKRHILSTSQFNLSNNLHVLNYNKEAIYNSFITLHKSYQCTKCTVDNQNIDFQSLNTFFSDHLMKKIMNKELLEKINTFNKLISWHEVPHCVQKRK